jgi:hypothetical protein
MFSVLVCRSRKSASQLSIYFAKWNDALDVAARIENLNFAGAKPCAILGVIDRLISLRKNRRCGSISRYWPRLAGLIVPVMLLLTLPTSIPDGRREAALCRWYDDEAHAPSNNVSVSSSSVVVFILLPR